MSNCRLRYTPRRNHAAKFVVFILAICFLSYLILCRIRDAFVWMNRLCREENILQYPALSDSSLVTEIIPEYEDVTGQDTEKIEACARILKSKFKIFKMKINQISALADATCSASD